LLATAERTNRELSMPGVHALVRPFCGALLLLVLPAWQGVVGAGPPAAGAAAKAREPMIGVVGDVTCATDEEGLAYDTRKTRVLVLGGLDGSRESYAAHVAAWAEFHRPDLTGEQKTLRDGFTLVAAGVNLSGVSPSGAIKAKGNQAGKPLRGFPPRGQAYTDEATAPAHYLWRWIGMHAPDVVIEVRHGDGKGTILRCPAAADVGRLAAVSKPWKVEVLAESDELVPQLVRVAPCGTGKVAAFQLETGDVDGGFLFPLLERLGKAGVRGPSPARKEIQDRLARSPLQVAEQLSKRYGHDLSEVAYIPALALIGRLRLATLMDDARRRSEIEKDIERIVAAYAAGTRPTLSFKPSGSHLSGHLVFGELADRTKKRRYVELATVAADVGFDGAGRPRESMPYHDEMSDAVFMGCPILAQVGRLTGDAKYFDQCLRHFRFMQKLVLRRDGLYRHSPLNETAWGRGNGFPALGLALSIGDFPATHPGRAELLQALREHLDVLARHQDDVGCWRQVIDNRTTYRELSCTSMITFAMLRGVRSGWLPRDKYEPLIRKAWPAIQARIAANGELVDVCTGTGKQRSLADYRHRAAILGVDARGGAMALLVATEMAAWEKKR
jgi:rhamnogalacturonyl hydrolase YesR